MPRYAAVGCLAVLLLLPTQASAQPPAPVALNAVSTGATVSLTWIPASGIELLGYQLEAGFAPGLANAAVIFVPARGYTATAVPTGTYYVRVRAIDRQGIGPPSSEIVVVVDAGVPCTTPPAAPVAFQVTVTDETGIDFTWDRPTDNCFPTGYLVLVGNAPGLSNLAAFNIGPGFAFEFDVPVGAYYVRLAALNEFGQSPQSNEVLVVWDCGDAPGPPQGLGASVTGAFVRLSWSRPTTGCAPSAYELHAGSAPGLSDVGVFGLGSNLTFAATAPSGTYYVRVVARNRAGVGTPSNELRLVVPQ